MVTLKACSIIIQQVNGNIHMLRPLASPGWFQGDAPFKDNQTPSAGVRPRRHRMVSENVSTMATSAVVWEKIASLFLRGMVPDQWTTSANWTWYLFPYKGKMNGINPKEGQIIHAQKSIFLRKNINVNNFPKGILKLSGVPLEIQRNFRELLFATQNYIKKCNRPVLDPEEFLQS